MKKLLAFSFLAAFTILPGHAQEKKELVITGNFENLTLKDFFNKLESQAPCFFYYDVNQLDSNLVNLSVQNEPLSSVLEKALKSSGPS